MNQPRDFPTKYDPEDFTQQERFARIQLDKFFMSGVYTKALEKVIERLWHADKRKAMEFFRDIVTNKEWTPDDPT